ncbi:MAG: metallophosphoesterase [Promethearchaeota archaeon]
MSNFDGRRLVYFLVVTGAVAGLFTALWFYNHTFWYSVPYEKGPYLSWQGATNSTMTISWETTVECNTLLEYGRESDLADAVLISNATKATLHSVELTDLSPGTKYFYRVGSGSSSQLSSDLTQIYSFVTGPSTFQPFKFVVYGDCQWDDIVQNSRTNWVTNRIVANELTESTSPAISFAIQTGDQFHYGDKNPHDVQRWFSMVRPLARRVPIMPAMGNHDRKGSGGVMYDKYFFLPNDTVSNGHDYVFTYANCYFIVLDITYYKPGYISDDRLAWVDARIAEGRSSRDWVFVAFHVPPYASQFDFPYYQERLAPLFVDRVDAVFSGHLHYYEHLNVDGVDYFVSGGGGGTLNGVNTVKDYNGTTTSHQLSRQYHYLRVEVGELRTTVTAISAANELLEVVNIEGDK